MKSFLRGFLSIGILFSAATTAAHAVSISHDETGEVAVIPYYTVRDGWLTTLNLSNQQEFPIAVRIRFMEGMNNRDVLNFTVLLPAFDTFAGVIREASDSSGPAFVGVDDVNNAGLSTCTVPINMTGNQTALSTRGFGPPGSPNDDGGPSGDSPEAIDRLREGHIQVFVLGHTAGTDIAAQINNFDCTALESAFFEGDLNDPDRPIAKTARQFGEPISSIRVQAGLLNPGRGVEAQMPVTHWNHFFDRDTDPETGLITVEDNSSCTSTAADPNRWEPGGAGMGYCRNLITAQDTIANLEPGLHSGFPPVASWLDRDGLDVVNLEPDSRTRYTLNPGPGFIDPLPPATIERPRFVDALGLTIMALELRNTWSSNPDLGVASDMLLSLPTKGFHTDGGRLTLGPGDYSAINSNRPGVLQYVDSEPQEEAYAPFEIPTGNGQAPYSVFTSGWSRSGEQLPGFTFEPGVSNGFPHFVRAGIIEMYSGLNVIRVDSDDQAGVLASAFGFDDEFVPEGINSGIIEVRLNSNGATNQRINATRSNGPFQGQSVELDGLPTLGFVIRQRTFGSVTKNFASAIANDRVVDIRTLSNP